MHITWLRKQLKTFTTDGTTEHLFGHWYNSTIHITLLLGYVYNKREYYCHNTQVDTLYE